jgi:hypothetical protein
VVTNGDQTDTVANFLREGKSYIEALRTRCYEPDPDNYTPRISGVVLEDGVIFWCDPRKNVNCQKDGCYIHGGPCRFTTNPKCAKEVKG